MADAAIETRTYEQLAEATSLSPDALTAVQEPGGPVKKIAIKKLLGKLISTDAAYETRAALFADLAYAAPATTLVYADPTPAYNGWYNKLGAINVGSWNQFEKLSAQAAAEVAAQVVLAVGAAGAAAIGVSESGSDASDHITAAQGATTANTTSESTNCIGPNIWAPRGGKLDTFSIRMTAAGTGNIVLVDRNTNKVLRKIAVAPGGAGIITFTAGVAGFPIVFVPKNCGLFYEWLSGGFARYVTGSGSTARFALGAAVGATVTIATAVHDTAITWTVTGPTASLRRRVAQVESASILGRVPSVWDNGYDCEQGGGSTLPDFAGGVPWDLSTAVGFSWGKGFFETTAGYVKTPPTMNIKTVLIFCRTTENSTAGYLYCSPSQKAMQQQNAGSFASFDVMRAAGGWGRHTLARRNDANGSAAYEINGGGWVAFVLQLAAGETGVHAIGALVNNAAACDNLKVAAILTSAGNVTDAEMDQTIRALSTAKKTRGIFLLSSDCPITTDFIPIGGDSNAQGSAYVSSMAANDLAFRFLESMGFARDALSAGALWASAPASAYRVGVNHGSPDKITQAEIGFAYQLARGMEERGWTGRNRLFATIAQGSTYMGPSGTYANAAGGNTTIAANQTFHPGELPSAGRFYTTWLRELYRLDQQSRLAGIGLSHPVAMIRSVTSNDRYVGTGFVTSGAVFQQWTEDFRAATVLHTGWQIFRDILVPGSPQDPDLVGNANRQTADGYCAAGLAAYAGVDGAKRKVMNTAAWGVNPGADAVHYSFGGTVTGANEMLDHVYSAAPKLPLFPTSLALAYA